MDSHSLLPRGLRTAIAIIVLSVMLIFGFQQTGMVSAAQALPASPWYAIVYQPETDTLHWINAAGEQASQPRPTLPNEAQYLDMRISPNGQTLVMVSELVDSRQAIGVYDLAAGIFVQTHQAQPGETVTLGGEQIFTANSQYFAVGLFSGDFANPAWRVILFESQSGDTVALMDHTHPQAPQVQLSAPAVQYLDGTSVHFQMIPQSVGGAAQWPAYRWQAFGFDPESPAIEASPYTRANAPIQLLTGKTVISYTDEAFPAAPQDGQTPNFNAIGAYIPSTEGMPTNIHVDSTRYHLLTRWAKGGEWILFLSDDAMQNRYWNIVLADGIPGNNSHMPLDPQFVQVYGTSDGYLLINQADMLMFTNGFMPNTAITLKQLTAMSEVVYVTPLGVNFALGTLGGENEVVAVTPTATTIPVIGATEEAAPTDPPPPLDCSLAPPQRVSIGSQARVVPSMGGLNVRQDPNGAILLTLTGGDVFNVIGGAICDEGLYWWQIDRSGTIGWLAEGSSSSYFIEPYAGPPPASDTPVPPPPPQGGSDDLAPPPAPTGCEGTLPPRLSIGEAATTLRQLSPRNGPDGEAYARRFYLEGTAVIITAGPECSGGTYWYLVSGQAKVGRIGQNFEQIEGWVPETLDGAYTLQP